MARCFFEKMLPLPRCFFKKIYRWRDGFQKICHWRGESLKDFPLVRSILENVSRRAAIDISA
jgi:hypothetical protein